MAAQLTAEVKATAQKWIDENLDRLVEWHTTIWELAEPAWREYRSQQWYVKRLREEGFEVEDGSAGMPTAFNATWSNGDGPTVLTYAEYDAVPGNSQAASTEETPREGLSRFAPGTLIHTQFSVFQRLPWWHESCNGSSRHCRYTPVHG